jgi:NitT/TauT family transport system permease protein
VPLALIWFGPSETAMLFVVVMGTVGSVVIATDHGTRSIPPIFARRPHRWARWFPPMDAGDPAGRSAVLVSGMKQAFTWRSLMAAEIYVTILTGFALGHLLHTDASSTRWNK